jgi:hypothetical protein
MIAASIHYRIIEPLEKHAYDDVNNQRAEQDEEPELLNPRRQ